MKLTQKRKKNGLKFGLTGIGLLSALLISVRCSHMDTTQSLKAGHRLPNSYSNEPKINRVDEVPEGLSGDDAANFYHLSEGADVYPYEWFKALRSVGFSGNAKEAAQMPKFHDKFDSRFGIINDPNNQTLTQNGSKKTFLMSEVGLTASWSDHAPDKSDAFQEDKAISTKHNPTTFYRDVNTTQGPIKSIRMVGTNCALCHTSELTTKSGKPVRLDGGANIFNVRSFFQDMSKSTVAMLYKKPWLEQFLKDLNVKNANTKAQEIHDYFVAEVGKDTALFNDIINPKYSADITMAFAKLLGDTDRLFKAQGAIARTLTKLLRVTYGFNENDNIGVLEARMRYLGNMMVGTNPKTKEIIAGYGRTDAFGRISNIALRGENPVDLTGEVSFPWIWGIKYMAMLHYNANTNSVILRNTGQSIGLGALILDDKNNSTVNIYNLDRLEHLVHKIKYPQWTQLFPDYRSKSSEFYIDTQKASRGKAIYEQKCQKCHESNIFVGPNENEEDNKLRYFKEFPLEVIGTDKTVAFNATEPIKNVKTGKDVAFEVSILKSVKAIKKRYYEKYSVNENDQKIIEFADLRGPEFFRDTVRGFDNNNMSRFKANNDGTELKYGAVPKNTGYKARQLSSVWATGPFLHNGSVPTIWDLLQPSSKRPKYFDVLSREFDPRKLGYKNDRKNKPCEKDEAQCFTTIPPKAIPIIGEKLTTNVNTGHEGVYNWTSETGEKITWDFGTNMPDADKWALIEYLKVLPPDSEYNWKDRTFEDAIQ